MAELTAELSAPAPFDLGQIFNAYRLRGLDPTARLERDRVWFSSPTPVGPASLVVAEAGSQLTVNGWGEGASWLVDRLPQILGAGDDPLAMPRRSPALAAMHQRCFGLRIGTAPSLLPAMIRVILRQRVTYDAAVSSWARLVRNFGEPAPGPGELLLPPDAATLASLPEYRYRQCDVDRQRAATIRRVCKLELGGAIERLREQSLAQVRDRLLEIPGIGEWTAGMFAGLGLGEPDAVVTGDLHLPAVVAWVLARETGADDQRMLELLEPYRGHRFRVVRLLWATKQRAPRGASRRIRR